MDLPPARAGVSLWDEWIEKEDGSWGPIPDAPPEMHVVTAEEDAEGFMRIIEKRRKNKDIVL